MKIGVCGLGFVGNAMMTSFHKKSIDCVGYDKFKNGGIGTFDSLLSTDILFLALPTPFVEVKKGYDLSSIKEVLTNLVVSGYKGVVVIKSTITPETTDRLSTKYGLQLVHNPEFLTARTAETDFHEQKHIVLGKSVNCSTENYQKVVNFYKNNYSAEISECTSTESESMKLFCNCFYATKIQLFNEFYFLCQNNGSNYDLVKTMMLKNGWINPMHTNVPGPDGKPSYGGMCFPKDIKALNSHMKEKNKPHAVLTAVIEEREEMRND